MRRTAALVLSAVLTSCDKPAPPAHPVVPAAAIPPQPPPAVSREWKGTRVSIPVARRTVREHIRLLDAQSPFRKRPPGGKEEDGFWFINIREDRTIEWGSEALFWEALLGFCARTGLRIDNIGDKIWLTTGLQKIQALQAIGPVLVGIDEIKAEGGQAKFRLVVAFEPQFAPDSPGAPAVRAGGRGLTPQSVMSGVPRWGWSYEVPLSNPGPLDARFEFERPVESALLRIDPVAGSSTPGPDGKGKVTVKEAANATLTGWDGKKQDGFRISATEVGLEATSRWMQLADGTRVNHVSWQSMGFGGSRDTTAEFPKPAGPGARYVLEVVTRKEKVSFNARVERLDWELWTRDTVPLQGRIIWPKPPGGKTEVFCGLSRMDGAELSTTRRTFDMPALAAGGDAASAERWWTSDGPLSLGVRDDDRFPAFRAEILDDGQWLAWIRVGPWLDAVVFTVSRDGERHDVPVDPGRAASIDVRGPAGATFRLAPCDRDGTRFPLPDTALGPLARIPVAGDGTFRMEGLRPGNYSVGYGGKEQPVVLKAGNNQVRVE